MTLKDALDTIWKNAIKESVGSVSRIETNGPATIVFWSDGTKTVVKRSADCPDSMYNAFTAALAIKVFGSNSQVNKILRTKVRHQQSKPVKAVTTDAVTEQPNKWTLLDDTEPVYTPAYINPHKDDEVQREHLTAECSGHSRPKFNVGDRVKLRWPEHEKPDMIEDFSHICLVVIPEDENGMVCVLVGNEQGLKRRDIQAERLEMYD